jgi:hypothetical protein
MKRVLLILVLVMMGCEGDYTIYDMHPPEIIEIEVEVLVEVPVEVIVEVPVPDPGGDVWIDSFEQPYTMNGIDIIWLIDRSCSMNSFTNDVVLGIEAMMNALPPAGWRLGIATTSRYETTQASGFPLVPGDSVQDAWDAFNSLSIYGHEAGFDALIGYLDNNTYNPTWLRQDAGLLVVFVSDEAEQSNFYVNSAPLSVQQFVSWYGSQRTSVFLASIVNVPAAESVCPNPPSAINIGTDYIEATNYFGGTIVDICAEDWSPGVQAATAQVLPFEEWELTYTPIEDTIIVFVDFVEFTDWTYNLTANVVYFDIVPPEGSLVEIGYVIDYCSGDDDDSAGN